MQISKKGCSSEKFGAGRAWWALLICAFVLSAAGCESLEGKITPSPAESSALTGVFADDPVAGLGYRTPTWKCVTDKRGRFIYQQNERITFFIGGLMLGETLASDKVTPLDLVPEAVDERDHSVVNIRRLLRSLDWDGDPENGILLTEEVTEEFSDLSLDFSLPPADFGFQPQIVNLFSILNAMQAFAENTDRTLCSVDNILGNLGPALFGDSHILQNAYSPHGLRSTGEIFTAAGLDDLTGPVRIVEAESIEKAGLEDDTSPGNNESFPEGRYEGRLRQMINNYRAQNSRGPLAPDPNLHDLAKTHGLNMLELGAMSHEGFNDRFRRSGYSICVENVGWNYQTPEAIFNGWKNSTEHDRALLDRRIGFAGISREGGYVTFFACGR